MNAQLLQPLAILVILAAGFCICFRPLRRFATRLFLVAIILAAFTSLSDKLVR